MIFSVAFGLCLLTAHSESVIVGLPSGVFTEFTKIFKLLAGWPKCDSRQKLNGKSRHDCMVASLKKVCGFEHELAKYVNWFATKDGAENKRPHGPSGVLSGIKSDIHPCFCKAAKICQCRDSKGWCKRTRSQKEKKGKKESKDTKESKDKQET